MGKHDCEKIPINPNRQRANGNSLKIDNSELNLKNKNSNGKGNNKGKEGNKIDNGDEEMALKHVLHFGQVMNKE